VGGGQFGAVDDLTGGCPVAVLSLTVNPGIALLTEVFRVTDNLILLTITDIIIIYARMQRLISRYGTEDLFCRARRRCLFDRRGARRATLPAGRPSL